ncbi:hypothetical protein TrVGV298_002422 [Trichoderma virens]|nr:hypothetical protein TrVGV298_002422 [Trichoderma virens]
MRPPFLKYFVPLDLATQHHTSRLSAFGNLSFVLIAAVVTLAFADRDALVSSRGILYDMNEVPDCAIRSIYGTWARNTLLEISLTFFGRAVSILQAFPKFDGSDRACLQQILLLSPLQVFALAAAIMPHSARHVIYTVATLCTSGATSAPKTDFHLLYSGQRLYNRLWTKCPP